MSVTSAKTNNVDTRSSDRLADRVDKSSTTQITDAIKGQSFKEKSAERKANKVNSVGDLDKQRELNKFKKQLREKDKELTKLKQEITQLKKDQESQS